MASAKNFMITAALCVGVTVAGSGTALAATPSAAQVAPAAVITQPSDWNNDNDNHDWNRDRDHDNGNWDRGHNNGDWWRFNRRIYAVSPWQCRWGHGRVDWHDGKCWGGRFSGARLRWW